MNRHPGRHTNRRTKKRQPDRQFYGLRLKILQVHAIVVELSPVVQDLSEVGDGLAAQLHH